MFSIGQTIQVEPIEELRIGEDMLTYTTEVTASDEADATFRIKKPVLEASVAADIFRVGARFYIMMVEEDGEVYQFESNVLEVDENEILFHQPEQVKRIQRRAYVRADINVPVTFNGTTQVETEDLSGGGMHIIAPLSRELHVHDELKSVIHLSENEAIKNVGKIVRLDKNEVENVQHVYVSFTEIDEMDRRKIVYYCFQKQIEEYRSQR